MQIGNLSKRKFFISIYVEHGRFSLCSSPLHWKKTMENTVVGFAMAITERRHAAYRPVDVALTRKSVSIEPSRTCSPAASAVLRNVCTVSGSESVLKLGAVWDESHQLRISGEKMLQTSCVCYRK
jgi:hypothetical protein